MIGGGVAVPHCNEKCSYIAKGTHSLTKNQFSSGSGKLTHHSYQKQYLLYKWYNKS